MHLASMTAYAKRPNRKHRRTETLGKAWTWLAMLIAIVPWLAVSIAVRRLVPGCGPDRPEGPKVADVIEIAGWLS